MTFNKILRGMQHERIKYQERVMSEFEDKTKTVAPNLQDDEFERKIQELFAILLSFASLFITIHRL